MMWSSVIGVSFGMFNLPHKNWSTSLACLFHFSSILFLCDLFSQELWLDRDHWAGKSVDKCMHNYVFSGGSEGKQRSSCSWRFHGLQLLSLYFYSFCFYFYHMLKCCDNCFFPLHAYRQETMRSGWSTHWGKYICSLSLLKYCQTISPVVVLHH